MGACCSFEPLSVTQLIKAQSIVRRWFAILKKNQRRQAYLMKIANLESASGPAGTFNEPLFSAQEIAQKVQEDNKVRFICTYPEQTVDDDDPDTKKKYQGQWRIIGNRRFKDGLGIMEWEDQSRYQGQFVRGRMEGRGRMTQANGSIYQGEWRAGMANGYGVFIDSQGSTYEGGWQDDLQHGEGQETWNGGSIRFKGQYFEGKKNGWGRYEWADGSFYEGEFVDSVFQGRGVYYFAESERTYEGEFSQNLFEGKGKLTFKDGRSYEGDFRAGKKEGNGTMVFPNGNKYIGGWENDLQHGIGIYFSAKEGVKKQGQWNQGKRSAWLSKPIKFGGK